MERRHTTSSETGLFFPEGMLEHLSCFSYILLTTRQMAPHAMDTILQPPQWPASFSNFVTWCLMWDPKNRPTSLQAMDHEFFADAVDPLRPKSSSRLLGRKHSDLSFRSKEVEPTLTSKPSWFRRSLIARESAPAVPLAQHDVSLAVQAEGGNGKQRPPANKRATWQGTPASGAPMPILPSIKPVSPIPNTVNAQAQQTETKTSRPSEDKSKKIGRQLSVNSHGNHYPDVHRQEAEKALTGNGRSGLVSPLSAQKESFFSHLRKRARRFSGRHGLASPGGDDIEAQAANVPWSNRSSMIVDKIIPEAHTDFLDLDQALQSVRYSLDKNDSQASAPQANAQSNNHSPLKRTHSLSRSRSQKSSDNLNSTTTPVTGRSRRTFQLSANPVQQYDVPAEEDELLDEALNGARRAARRLNADSAPQKDANRQSMTHITSQPSMHSAYLTPSPSANRDGVQFGYSTQTPSKPLNITHQKQEEYVPSHWPTPPYEDNEWASRTAANIFALNPTPNYR